MDMQGVVSWLEGSRHMCIRLCAVVRLANRSRIYFHMWGDVYIQMGALEGAIGSTSANLRIGTERLAPLLLQGLAQLNQMLRPLINRFGSNNGRSVGRGREKPRGRHHTRSPPLLIP